ncbi:hypothetical protein LOK49_LG04G00811 [Camellia lanceoleosa]|uniref:Uncharacterized protein n=1 Tax=Camellia lanceoleosa TaxID=1840588 RepID=A0ACC0I632_9ERIC|nr:hypothetical protein LOK49_LG04G00811 [Camellia lanceoleosa]
MAPVDLGLVAIAIAKLYLSLSLSLSPALVHRHCNLNQRRRRSEPSQSQTLAPVVVPVLLELGIRHNKNSCKFIGREAGYNFGYGPHLRTRVAPKLNLPADFIQQQIDEMEARIRPLLDRKNPVLTEEPKSLVARVSAACDPFPKGQSGTLEGMVQGPPSCSAAGMGVSLDIATPKCQSKANT